MLKNLKSNKNGVIFITILMIIIVLMVLAVSIISLNVSQVISTEAEVKRIQAEAVAVGAVASSFAARMTNSQGGNLAYSQTFDNTTFTVNSVIDNIGGGVLNTDDLTITVTY